MLERISSPVERVIVTTGTLRDSCCCRILEAAKTDRPMPYVYEEESSEYRLSMLIPTNSGRPDDVTGKISFPEFLGTMPVPVTSLLFRPANVKLRAEGRRSRPGRRIQLAFTEERFLKLTHHDPRWTLRELEASASLGRTVPSIAVIMQKIAAEMDGNRFGRAEAIDALSTLAMVELSRYLHDIEETDFGVISSVHMRAIQNRLQDTDAPIPRIEQLASLCGVSSRHLLRLFKEQTGTTLIDYIRNVRLKQAQHLICHSDFAIKQIAHKLGFSSQTSFAESFKKEMGVTPARYRRDMRRFCS